MIAANKAFTVATYIQIRKEGPTRDEENRFQTLPNKELELDGCIFAISGVRTLICSSVCCHAGISDLGTFNQIQQDTRWN